jgi:hypothetical protein
VKRKKGRVATVDINESIKGEPVKILIIQVAALSWATTQVPEITAAPQSFLNAGFRSAAQVEFVVMNWRCCSSPRYKGGGLEEFQEFLFLDILLPATVGKSPTSP